VDTIFESIIEPLIPPSDKLVVIGFLSVINVNKNISPVIPSVGAPTVINNETHENEVAKLGTVQ